MAKPDWLAAGALAEQLSQRHSTTTELDVSSFNRVAVEHEELQHWSKDQRCRFEMLPYIQLILFDTTQALQCIVIYHVMLVVHICIPAAAISWAINRVHHEN